MVNLDKYSDADIMFFYYENKSVKIATINNRTRQPHPPPSPTSPIPA